MAKNHAFGQDLRGIQAKLEILAFARSPKKQKPRFPDGALATGSSENNSLAKSCFLRSGLVSSCQN